MNKLASYTLFFGGDLMTCSIVAGSGLASSIVGVSRSSKSSVDFDSFFDISTSFVITFGFDTRRSAITGNSGSASTSSYGGG